MSLTHSMTPEYWAELTAKQLDITNPVHIRFLADNFRQAAQDLQADLADTCLFDDIHEAPLPDVIYPAGDLEADTRVRCAATILAIEI